MGLSDKHKSNKDYLNIQTEMIISYAPDFFNSTVDDIAILETSGIIKLINPIMAKSIGYKVDDAIGKNLFEIFEPKESAKKRKERFYKAILDKRTIRFQDMRNDVWYDIYIRPLLDSNNEVTEVFLFARNITEIKESEMALEENQKIRQAILDASPVGIGLVKNRVIYWANDELHNILGYAKNELINQDTRMFYTNNSDFEKAGMELYKQLEKPDNPGSEWIWKKKDGKKLNCHVKISAIDPEDFDAGQIFTVLDITEKTRATIELMESEKKFRLLYENSADAMLVIDKKGIIDCNKATLQLFQSESKYNVVGIHPALLSPETQPDGENSFMKFREKIANGYNSGYVRFEWQFRTLYDEQVFVEISMTRIPQSGNDALFTICRNIADRKDAETKLSYQANLLEKVNDAIIAVEIKQGPVISAWNSGAERIYGWSKNEVIGKSWEQFFPSGDSGMHLYDLLNILREKNEYNGEFSRYAKGGKLIEVESRIIALTDVNNKFVGWVSVDRDISERKKSELRLRNSEEKLRNLAIHLDSIREDERKQIARDIRDELGQAVTTLKYDASWLMKKVPEDNKFLYERLAEMSKLIEKTGGNINRITSDLHPIVLDRMGLSAAIKWQTKEFEKKTSISCELYIEDIDSFLDVSKSEMIFRIYQEILSNTGKHSKATKVQINLHKKANRVELLVSDDGVGMSREQMNNPASFGLLAMTERVYNLKGRINIDSSQGFGTTISVSFPVGGSKSKSNINVLIADSNPIFRKGLAEVIQEDSFINVSADTSTERDLLFNSMKLQPDIIILDSEFSVRGVTEIIGDLINMKKDCKILVCFARADRHLAKRTISSGAAGIIEKNSDGKAYMQAIYKIKNDKKYIPEDFRDDDVYSTEEVKELMPHEKLSDREFQVMRLLVRGKRNKDISSELSISKTTVSTYRSRILEKMEMKDINQLTDYCMKQGIVK